MPRRLFVLAFVLLLFASPLSAAVISAVNDSMTGADLAGLVMRVSYLNLGSPNTIYTCVWVATGPTSGQCNTPELTLLGTTMYRLSGPTGALNAWQIGDVIPLSPIVSMEFDGSAAGVLFDRSSPNPGTSGSGAGLDFVPDRARPFTLSYQDAVMLAGSAGAIGDLYTRLTVTFTNVDTGPSHFSLDTDVAVPEASTLLLLGVATLVLGCRRKAFGRTSNRIC